MAITVGWDNDEQTLIRFDFNGRWTLEEFFTATRTAHSMIEATSHQGWVATLLNIGKNPFSPGNLISFTERGLANKHPRTLVIVLVTESVFFEMIQKTLLRVYPSFGKLFLHANTLDQGRELALQQLAEHQSN